MELDETTCSKFTDLVSWGRSARCTTWNALGLLGVRVDEIAEAAAVQLGTLNDEPGSAAEHGRLVVRDISVGWHYFVVVLERRVLNVRHDAWNWSEKFENISSH